MCMRALYGLIWHVHVHLRMHGLCDEVYSTDQKPFLSSLDSHLLTFLLTCMYQPCIVGWTVC